MKGPILTCVAVLTAAFGAYGQAQISFASIGPGVLFYTTNVAGSLCSGTNYAAAFYYGAPGSSADQLVVAGEPAFFLTLYPGLFVGGARTILGYWQFQAQVRVWDTADGSSWEEVMASQSATAEVGESILFLQYGSFPPGTPTALTPLNGHHIQMHRVPNIGPPVIYGQPFGLTNIAGSNAVFRVFAAGSPPLSYQWRKGDANLSDGGNVSGATTSSLVLSNVLKADEGNYSVVVTNASGSVTSAIATLMVIEIPIIAWQPSSQYATAGDNVSFGVATVGPQPLSFQWRKNGLNLSDSGNLSGTTNATLALSDVTGLDAGGYSVIVSSGFGSVTSAVATLTVVDPVIRVQPLSQVKVAGEQVMFSVEALGAAPLSYQWQKDGVAHVDWTQPSLTLANVQNGDAGSYSVVVSNSFGSITSAVATLGVINLVIRVPPLSQQGDIGESVTFTVDAAGALPISYLWRKDGVAHMEWTQRSLTLTNLQGSDAGTYDVIVSNSWNVLTSAVAVLIVNTAVVDDFNPGTGGRVLCMAIQADGKILVGGSFSDLAAQSRANLARLNSDGTLDAGFNPGANGLVTCLAVQPDGSIVVGGAFTTLGGIGRTNLGRLNADGTLDVSFRSETGGPSDYVTVLATQPDGKILVGGAFSELGGQSRNNLGRLNADGTLDESFNPGADGPVTALAVQADARILVGGAFISLAGQGRTHLGRINVDGTLDTGFGPWTDGQVQVLAVQPDAKILLGGAFSTVSGQAWANLGRLNLDGSFDETFHGSANGAVESLVLETDGKMVVGGSFGILAGENRRRIWRLNADGTVDATFGTSGADNTAYSLGLQPDGRILVGGSFNTLGGKSRYRLGRLNNTAPASQSLVYDGANLSWLRTGTGPELQRTTFEYSPDGGATWRYAGDGVRIPGGWQLSGLVAPTNTAFRARGTVVGGFLNGSSWFAETVWQPPLAISDFSLAGGHFGFSASGPAGRTVTIEVCPDLTTWTPVQTNTLGAEPLLFSDPESSTRPARFYRLRSSR